MALAADGWDICVGYRSDADAAARVVAACEAAGVRAVAAQGDVGEEAGVLELFAAADAFGSLGALVNNAGIVDVPARVDEMSAARIQRMMAVNVVGPFLCAREASKRMSLSCGGGGGVIVNVSSASARVGSPNTYVDYAASKGAIDTMTLGLAKELAGDGVRVNAVRPGIIDTEIHASGGQRNRASELGPQIPLGRAGRPDEIAASIAWLCSADASYVTGAILDVSGGR